MGEGGGTGAVRFPPLSLSLSRSPENSPRPPPLRPHTLVPGAPRLSRRARAQASQPERALSSPVTRTAENSSPGRRLLFPAGDQARHGGNTAARHGGDKTRRRQARAASSRRLRPGRRRPQPPGSHPALCNKDAGSLRRALRTQTRFGGLRRAPRTRFVAASGGRATAGAGAVSRARVPSESPMRRPSPSRLGGKFRAGVAGIDGKQH